TIWMYDCLARLPEWASRVCNDVSTVLGKAKSARMAYPYAQAPEVRADEGRLDVAQAIMAGMAASLLDLDLARQQIQLVVQHQDLLGLQLVEAHQGSGRL